MSDIYYCSNSKSKKTSNGSSASEKTPKTLKPSGNGSSNNNNNNINNGRDNNNICGKHTTTVNGKPMWNAKGLQNGAANGNQRNSVSMDSIDGTSAAVPQKTFHNARCTRHHKPHHTHSQNRSHSGERSGSHHHIGHMQPQSHSQHSNGHRRKSESVLSTDSDIRFTRRKLGDSQKCGCAVIAGFLVALLVAGIFVYLGYTFFKPEPLPDRVFRGKFVLLNEKWSMDLANQKSLRFQHKARDYRERINLVIRRSDLRESYEGSEILALDGSEDANDVIVHFNMVFDPYAEVVTTADLLALFAEEINSPERKYLTNMTVDPNSLTIKEVTGLPEEPIISSSPLGRDDETTELISTTPRPSRRCEPLRLSYCRHVGYNITTYPNLLGHSTLEEVQADVIAFRELVDAECFREAFDFVCRLLQPPCEGHSAYLEPTPGVMCREYCQMFMKGCGNRLPQRFQRFFDCERFPESTGIQSCQHKPRCANDLQTQAQSPRLCDGFADCPDLSDERTCAFCNTNSLYCGRGRACVPRKARCDGKADCPDGADEKDCLSIAPLAADLALPDPLVPYLPRFHDEGFAVFSEKGTVGKLCAEGLEGDTNGIVRQTVAESLCKSLGYESVERFEILNDTEFVGEYVRVLDPHAPEISFIRTPCPRRQVLYVGCGDLQCGVQSVLSVKQHLSLPKMSSPGDWPWLVALYREDIHVCDGTLISQHWVLTTESCFQGQPRATWMAIFGSVRLSSTAPWTQRRRIVGMIKSPVEGSTAALIRLETPVYYSDHVRPICLPDELQRKRDHSHQRRNFAPHAARLEAPARSAMWQRAYTAQRPLTAEMQEYFILPPSLRQNDDVNDSELNADSVETAASYMPRAESLTVDRMDQYQRQQHLDASAYPVPVQAPQVPYYSGARQGPTRTIVSSPTAPAITKVPATKRTQDPHRPEEIWTNCNTLGWSRQRDQLQRVQLKIGDMAPCENVSIATVNSMCTEATYQKHDCSQEEFSGAPVQCLMPGTNQWALIGVSSWRIACGPTTGVERPRMYDKISSNAAWIRDTIATA